MPRDEGAAHLCGALTNCCAGAAAGVRQADDRDFGRNLLAYSELIDPIQFNPGEALVEFGLWRLYLDTIARLAGAAQGTDQQTLYKSA